jgi:hypothetical protein
MEMFLRGAIAMGNLVAGLFFLRFWRQTHDRLFLIFAAAFGLLSLGRVAVVLFGHDVSEARTSLVYLIRLVAFVLIIAAIVDKNRARPGPTTGPR